MSEKKKIPSGDEKPIEIDYDRIDVASIMDQIKGRIASRERPALGDASPSGPAWPLPQPEPEAEPPGVRAGSKKILLKLMRPFSPLIKLLVFPVHQELRRTIVTLDQTNRRLDSLFAAVQKELPELRDAVNRRLDAALPPLQEDVADLQHFVRNGIAVGQRSRELMDVPHGRLSPWLISTLPLPGPSPASQGIRSPFP